VTGFGCDGFRKSGAVDSGDAFQSVTVFSKIVKGRPGGEMV